MDRRFLRPGWIAGHLLVVLAVLVCLRLGWWQWGRTHDTDGTAQNFGYALLWPAFAVAFIYMWVRFLQLEVIKDAEDQVPEMEKIPDPDPAADEFPDWGGKPRSLSNRESARESAREFPSGDRADATADVGAPGDRSKPPAGRGDAAKGDIEHGEAAPTPPPRRGRQRPSQGITISVATVGDDDADDPELTAYNRALAALAEEDRRRAR